MTDRVVILMATYNGQKYVREQIQSIQQQDFTDWKLIIHDDGSTDQTVSVIQAIADADERIQVEDVLPQHLGAKKGFHELLKHTEGDYFFFCDQDDVWLPNKVSETLSKLKALQGPSLVYTDLRVVDSNLNTLEPSMHRFSQYPDQETYTHLLVQNSITGCTMAINRALKNILITQDIRSAAMHDWWYALNAAARGNLLYLDNPLILYRQHSDNVVGAEKPFWQRLCDPSARRTALAGFRLLQDQALGLQAFEVPVKRQDIEDTQIVAELLEAGRFKTVKRLWQHNILKSERLKNIIFSMLLLTRPNTVAQ